MVIRVIAVCASAILAMTAPVYGEPAEHAEDPGALSTQAGGATSTNSADVGAVDSDAQEAENASAETASDQDSESTTPADEAVETPPPAVHVPALSWKAPGSADAIRVGFENGTATYVCRTRTRIGGPLVIGRTWDGSGDCHTPDGDRQSGATIDVLAGTDYRLVSGHHHSVPANAVIGARATDGRPHVVCIAATRQGFLVPGYWAGDWGCMYSWNHRDDSSAFYFMVVTGESSMERIANDQSPGCNDVSHALEFMGFFLGSVVEQNRWLVLLVPIAVCGAIGGTVSGGAGAGGAVVACAKAL